MTFLLYHTHFYLSTPFFNFFKNFFSVDSLKAVFQYLLYYLTFNLSRIFLKFLKKNFLRNFQKQYSISKVLKLKVLIFPSTVILLYHFIFCLSSIFLKFFQFFFGLIFSGEILNPPLFLFTLHYYNIIFRFICQYFFLIFLKNFFW